MGRVLATFLALLPTFAFASAEANVKLQFSNTDKLYLYASLAIGLIAIIYGFGLRKKLLALSPGDEKMQEVGAAIKEGALAYLRKQVSTMMIFVFIIGAILFGAYFNKYGPAVSGFLALSFVAGVAASYYAGYIGMKTAVDGNTRTAHAALSSYKLSLETAFKSGAVAGMLTVGLGLIGATAIFLLAGEQAMKLLVGFGFGGSLAALFMRVGGGIFTKAADVGADLVGKVEAGIPEDDPRNPAVIADNVGDNVGDCAGMAADVFESYEVTLVAAIVLGAATAQIFDQQTWMKLILFALVARGIGIVASIVGIASVKGSDDLTSDPLKPIQRGFRLSAVVAALITAAAAFLMMGGQGDKINVGTLRTQQDVRFEELMATKAVQNKVFALKTADFNATKKDGQTGPTIEDVTQDEVISYLVVAEKNGGADKVKWSDITGLKKVIATKTPAMAGDATKVTTPDLWKEYTEARKGKKATEGATALAAYEYEKAANQGMLANNLGADATTARAPDKMTGYTEVSFADKTNPVYNYTVQRPVDNTNPANAAKPEYIALGDLMSGDKGYGTTGKLAFLYLKLGQAPTTPTPRGETPKKDYRYFAWGPIDVDIANKVIDKAKKEQNIDVVVEKTYKAVLMSNTKGQLAFGVGPEVKTGEAFTDLLSLQPAGPGMGLASYYTKSVAEVKAAMENPNPNNPVAMPRTNAIPVAQLIVKEAAWWRFLLCILIGIFMAIVFEKLTDYYVALEGKPVSETAAVSTAGPAPMIIQGFSYGLESSVFSVVAIVISLLAPLFIFPPALYGGPILSFYGIALVGLGLLTTTGYILAMDTFGPISDNAQGVFEMSGAGHSNPEAARAVQLLDAAGNTTKALTKGFAIATAVVAAVALFHSFVEDAMLTGVGMPLEKPEIFLGLLIGGAAPYLFSAFSINAVGRAAFDLINNVRQQFRNDPGIMAGTSKPNYASCVAIVTQAAQRELMGPGILAIFLPLAVAFGFSLGGDVTTIGNVEVNLSGAQALGGFLVGCIVSGQLLAVLLANSGGLWDNSKKLIEDGKYGGKGTDAHKAAVVCDTVGDPFKDTAGPALNPLIKVMNLVALLIAPIVILPLGKPIAGAITVISLLALSYSIWFSKRSSMATGMEDMSS